MSCITEGSTGYPGSNGYIPFENGFLSEILLQHGYNTYALGKWHLTPATESTGPGPTTAGRWAAGSNGSTGFSAPTRTSTIRTWSTTTIGRPAQDSGGGLPFHRGHHGQGHQLHRRRQAGRAEQAVLHVFLPGRGACAPPRAQGVGGQVQGQVRHGLGRVPGDGVRTPEEAGHRPARRRALAPRPRRQAVGQVLARGEEALCPDDGGVRRIPLPHRPPHRPTDRLPK